MPGSFTVFDCAVRVASIVYDTVCPQRKLFIDLKHTPQWLCSWCKPLLHHRIPKQGQVEAWNSVT